MSEVVNPSGYIEDEQTVGGVNGRLPVATRDLVGAKVSPSGYIYKEKEVDGIIGIMPVISVEGGGTTPVTTPNLQQVTDKGAVTTNVISVGTGTGANNAATYKQLTDNLINADWNATTGLAEIKNKPIIPTTPSLQQVTDIGNVTTRQVTVGGVIFNKATASTVDYVALNIADEEIGRLHCDHTGSVVVSGGTDSAMTGNVYIRPKGITNNSQELVVLRTGDPLFNGNKMWHAGNLPYEEGAWTPSLRGVTATPSASTGRYVKVGKLVTVWCNYSAALADVVSGTIAYMDGLPFPSNGLSEYLGILMITTRLSDIDLSVAVSKAITSSVIFVKNTPNTPSGAAAKYGTDLSLTQTNLNFTLQYST